MKNSRESEFERRLNSEKWGDEIASRVFTVRRHRKNVMISAIFMVAVFLGSAFGIYQSSANSSIAMSAQDEFTVIFSDEVNLQKISFFLE